LNHAIVGRDGRLYDQTVGLGARTRLWAKTHLVSYGRVRDAVRNSGIGVEPAKNSPSVFEYYRSDRESAGTERDLLAGLGKLRVFADRHAAGLQLVYVPLTVEGDFGPLRDFAAKSGVALQRDVPLSICATVAQDLRLPLYDLRPVLEQTLAAGHALNVKTDFHYSAVLSRASAATLAARRSCRLGEVSQPRTSEMELMELWSSRAYCKD
jgi:hypothetical protein